MTERGTDGTAFVGRGGLPTFAGSWAKRWNWRNTTSSASTSDWESLGHQAPGQRSGIAMRRFAGDPADPKAWAFDARAFNATVGLSAVSGIPGERGLNDRQDARQAGTRISQQER